MSFKCCKDCNDRFVGCHSECSKYLKAKEEHKVQKEWAEKHKTPNISSYDFNRVACVDFKRHKKIR